MFTYTAERLIRRPLDEVFGFLADATRQTQWVHGVTECKWKEGGAAPGAVAEQSMTFLGKKRIVPMTVVDYEPGRRVVFEKRHPFLIRFGFEVSAEGDGTRVRYPVEMTPKGLFRIIIGLIGKRTIDGDLDRIAHSLEG